MYFKLSTSQEDFLLRQPETGMGYQIVEANRQGSYITEKFVVLNVSFWGKIPRLKAKTLV